ncbi:MAG: twin-arginine translocase subunit TatC, partial [Flavobacteriales bacterium]
LEEFRKRLLRTGAAVLLFALLAFFFKEWIFEGVLFWPKEPDFPAFRFLCSLSARMGMGDRLCITPPDFPLVNLEMAGQFSAHILVSIISGIVIAFPYFLQQMWAFLNPGLRKKERRSARRVFWVGTFLFILGILFGYFVMSPLSVRFLGGYQVSEMVSNKIRLSSYVSTVSLVTLSAGILFQLPVVVHFLAITGIMTPSLLRSYRKHALIVVLLLSAIITPPDITSQLLVAFPLLILYEISIRVAARVAPPAP